MKKFLQQDINESIKRSFIRRMPAFTRAQISVKLDEYKKYYSELEEKKKILIQNRFIINRKSRVKNTNKILDNISNEIVKLEGKLKKKNDFSEKIKTKINDAFTLPKEEQLKDISNKDQSDDIETVSKNIIETAKKTDGNEAVVSAANEIQKLVDGDNIKPIEKTSLSENISANKEDINKMKTLVQKQNDKIQKISDTLVKIESNMIDEQNTGLSLAKKAPEKIKPVNIEKSVQKDKKGGLLSLIGSILGPLGLKLFNQIKKAGSIKKWFGGLLKSGLKFMFDNISKLGSSLKTLISDTFEKFKNGLLKTIEPIKKFIAGITEKIANFGSQIKDAISKGIEKVKSISGSLAEKVKSWLPDLSKFKDSAKKVSSEIVEKAGKSAGVAKTLGKSAIKKIPGIGLVAGLGFAMSRLVDGDVKGAGLEIASGALSLIPGIGTAASAAIDVYSAKRDYDMAEKSDGRENVQENDSLQKIESAEVIDKERKDRFVQESSKVLSQEFIKFKSNTQQPILNQQPVVAINSQNDINTEYNNIHYITNNNVLENI